MPTIIIASMYHAIPNTDAEIRISRMKDMLTIITYLHKYISKK